MSEAEEDVFWQSELLYDKLVELAAGGVGFTDDRKPLTGQVDNADFSLLRVTDTLKTKIGQT